MIETVENVTDIRRNLSELRRSLLSHEGDEMDLARDLLRRGYNLVAARIDGDVIFGPSRFVGYKKNSVRSHDFSDEKHGTETNRAISKILGAQITKGDPDWSEVYEIFLRFCEQIDIAPTEHERKFWVLDQIRPDKDDTYSEGALSFHVTTRYERDPAARKACIEAHGTSCTVCGMNFETTYGDHGKGFIHVHHLKPLSQAAPGNRTDPVNDLVPVCPNCHYMLHRGNKLLSPDELKRFMSK